MAAPATRGLFVGTSGWVYPSWRQHLYRGVPRRAWLSHAAGAFGALEINGSFYVQIAEATYARWRDETPAGFVFTLKGHRFVTHYKRLRDVDDAIARQRGPTLALGDRLRAVVWQLPARMSADVPRLGDFLRALERWPEVRHVLELRHTSWFTDEVADRLAAARAAVCLSDAPDFPMWRRVTTDLVYVRLHGHTRKYASSYRRDALTTWACEMLAWSAAGCEVHTYLDNDAEGAAVKNAVTLRAEIERLRSPVGRGVAHRPASGAGEPKMHDDDDGADRQLEHRPR